VSSSGIRDVKPISYHWQKILREAGWNMDRYNGKEQGEELVYILKSSQSSTHAHKCYAEIRAVGLAISYDSEDPLIEERFVSMNIQKSQPMLTDVQPR
jgi:hypothetical protein